MIKVEHHTEEQENDNADLDRCDVCKIRLAENQNCKAESQSVPRTTRRNPSRSAKRNILYRDDDSETDLIKEDNSLKQHLERTLNMLSH